MEIKEIRAKIDPPPLFEAGCEHCGHRWYPYEGKNLEVTPPREVELECPECGKTTICFWADEEMNREILHRRYVLGYDEKIENATKQVEKLKNERDEWKNRYDQVFQNNTKLTNAIDRLSQKLEQLGVQVDKDDKNPLSN